MHLAPHQKDRFHYLAIVLIILIGVLGICGAVYFGIQADNRIRNELSTNSQTAAAGLGYDKIADLKGIPEDANLASYTDLKQQLANVKAANDKIRSVYLMGKNDDRIFFYVDSEQPDSPDYSPAAEAYDDATPELQAMFSNGQPLVEGPVSDDFGTFISGLAPIKSDTGQIGAVLGIDVSSSSYWRDIGLSALIPLTTGLTLILIVAFFEWVRWRNMQMMALRSELMSVASHELRTPITGIRWAAEMLEPLAKDDSSYRMVHSIRRSAENLQASTEDILDLFNSINRTSLVIEEVDLAKLVVDAVDIQRLSAQKKGVTILFDSTWPASLRLRCDGDKMKRVLHNVISNAVKYTRNDSTVKISYTNSATMHNIIVNDQGIGIPQAEQGRVFKGFYRATNAKASDIPGTGLGLYLVKTVLEKHHGTVSFESEENVGTTITLSLPVK